MKRGFADMARQAFSFLEDAGFRLARRTLTELRYESARSFVTVAWDRRSGELQVVIGPPPRAGQSQDAYSLEDILALERPEAEPNRPFEVAEERQLAVFLEKLAEAVRMHAKPALTGDRIYFRRLEALRHDRSRTYMQDMKLRRARAEAEDAWRKKDFGKLIGCYASIEDELSEAEKKKLAYARQHQRKSRRGS